MGTATAVVPGHVTVCFTVDQTETPARTGSRGAGLALEAGVTVSVRPGSGCTLNGDPIFVAAVETVLETLEVEAAVALETDLPIGAGFGVSGAAALGTALAANDAFDVAKTETELIRLAHEAEVRAQTGLGDVVAQARGGVPLRLEPGAPPHGELDGIPATASIEYLHVGEYDTETVLAGDTSAITDAGESALDRVLDRPTLPALFAAGREFVTHAGLADPRIEEILDAVDAAGGTATMALLGRSIVALNDGLSAAGYEPTQTRIDHTGAHLVPDQ